MRYAVLSDVHANRQALAAAMDALSQSSVDRYICAGDIIGYGASPNHCVELLTDLGAVVIAGNHELMVLGRLSTRRCTGLARGSIAWTGRVLSDRTRSQLAALPLTRTLPGGVVMAHGSLQDPEEYVRQPAQALAQLDELTVRDPTAQILVLGHTHAPWAFGSASGSIIISAPGSVLLNPQERWLLNPGSVGQPRDEQPLARFMVLDTDAHRADFHSVPFDLTGSRADLRSAGRPRNSCLPRPGPVRRARSAVGRLVRWTRR